jgi:type IV pilus assembly protein PilB
MATAPNTVQLSGLAKSLIQHGLLTEDAATAASLEAKTLKQPLMTYLVNRKQVDSKTVAGIASLEFGLPFFDLDALDLSDLPIKLVSEKLIRQYQALPLMQRGNRLYVASADPTDFQAMDEIKFHTRLNTENIMVEADKLAKVIDKAFENL